MLLRAALIALSAAAIAFGVVRLRGADTCESTRSAMVSALFHHRQPAGGLANQQRRLVAHCRGRSVLAFVSTVETTAAYRALATSLARKVTRDEPRNRIGWVALAQALQRSDPRGAAGAVARGQAAHPQG